MILNVIIFELVKLVKQILRNVDPIIARPFVLQASVRPGGHFETRHAAQVIHRIKRIALQMLFEKPLNRFPVAKQTRVCVRPAQQDEIFAERATQVEPVRMSHD